MEMVKFALVEPAAIVTVAGTCAADALLLCRVTSAPPAGAAPFRVTVPVELFPPTIEVGFLVNEDRVATLTVSVALLVTPYVPEMTAEAFTVTGVVVTEKVAVVAPAETVTLVGTWATLVLLLVSGITAPPEGAGPLSVTVPFVALPPNRLVGLSASEESVGGLTVSVAACCVPPYVPDTVTSVELAIAKVVTVKVAVVPPAATVTLVGA